ncbi:hypothetical protein lerEdw1_015983 [Lerista edwardsae]|nr:hypothetical protein lerEdw1_015983 [Lerista edwardsae]
MSEDRPAVPEGDTQLRSDAIASMGHLWSVAEEVICGIFLERQFCNQLVLSGEQLRGSHSPQQKQFTVAHKNLNTARTPQTEADTAMAQRGPPLGLTTAVLLMAACLAVASAASYRNFLREHVDFPTTNITDPLQYCNRMMQRREMATASHCKHLNTFLHADPSYIEAVCGDGGQPTTGDLRESNDVFPLTLCRLQKSSWAPDCKYDGSSSTERIVIACVDGEPVHLQTEVPSDMESDE